MRPNPPAQMQLRRPVLSAQYIQLLGPVPVVEGVGAVEPPTTQVGVLVTILITIHMLSQLQEKSKQHNKNEQDSVGNG